MMRQFFQTCLVVAASGICVNQSLAAEVRYGQIVVENAQVLTASGAQFASIRLDARDGARLHERQIFQAQFGAANSASKRDGTYDQSTQEIFIPSLIEGREQAHQVTLRRISSNSWDFIVTEVTSFPISSTVSEEDFDPNAVHNVEYYRPSY